MFRIAADENVDWRILRGLKHRCVGLDMATAQEAGLAGQPDERVLDWATREDRVLLTHDVKTMLPLASGRVASGVQIAGVIIVQRRSVGQAINQLVWLLNHTEQADWSGIVTHL